MEFPASQLLNHWGKKRGEKKEEVYFTRVEMPLLRQMSELFTYSFGKRLLGQREKEMNRTHLGF